MAVKRMVRGRIVKRKSAVKRPLKASPRTVRAARKDARKLKRQTRKAYRAGAIDRSQKRKLLKATRQTKRKTVKKIRKGISIKRGF